MSKRPEKKKEDKKGKKEELEWEMKIANKINQARNWLKEKEVVDRSPLEKIQEELDDPQKTGSNSKENKKSTKHGKKQQTEENLSAPPQSQNDFLDLLKDVGTEIAKETLKDLWKELLK